MTRRDLASFLQLFAFAALPEPAMHSRVFHSAELNAKTNPNGNVTRAVFKGRLPTGEMVEVHETTLLPGNMPHPPHRHLHTEMMLLRTGRLEFISQTGSEPVAPGDIAWCASNELHGLKNSGVEPANYFVIAIGPDIQ